MGGVQALEADLKFDDRHEKLKVRWVMWKRYEVSEALGLISIAETSLSFYFEKVDFSADSGI